MDEHVGIDKIQQVLGHTRPEMTKRCVKRSTEDITKMLENRRAKVIPFRGRSSMIYFIEVVIKNGAGGRNRTDTSLGEGGF
jgi:hypothetical protein